ncbi:protein of unknown function (plasmid) [Cupriavidus neocaledonicus]|uniref:Transposase n=1 Tax=Cupriavidus neocaledonicus TaxID=1040979 RepID=A0A375HUY8_9BURK|nr:hypothetical protein CBM2605_B10133 [Cupriavidus neocaledonicus]SPD61233.1 protein of unknown function [Cupriavidus neocaledonicus]
MPRRTKTSQAADRDLPTIPEDLVAHFVKGPMTAEAVQDASMAFKKALIERALGAELGHHLGYQPGAERPAGMANQRNGKSAKTVLTEDVPLRVAMGPGCHACHPAARPTPGRRPCCAPRRPRAS